MKTRVRACCNRETFATREEAQRRLDKMRDLGLRSVLPIGVERCRNGWHIKFPVPDAPALARRAHIAARSAKQQAKYEVRRPLVEQILAEHPVCERCYRDRSTEVHEPRMRSRGVDICDPDECVALCHACHREVHDHPAQAEADGWMIPSGDKTTRARAAAERAALAAWTAREAS